MFYYSRQQNPNQTPGTFAQHDDDFKKLISKLNKRSQKSVRKNFKETAMSYEPE